MSKRKYLGGLMGANLSRAKSTTQTNLVTADTTSLSGISVSPFISQGGWTQTGDTAVKTDTTWKNIVWDYRSVSPGIGQVEWYWDSHNIPMYFNVYANGAGSTSEPGQGIAGQEGYSVKLIDASTGSIQLRNNGTYYSTTPFSGFVGNSTDRVVIGFIMDFDHEHVWVYGQTATQSAPIWLNPDGTASTYRPGIPTMDLQGTGSGVKFVGTSCPTAQSNTLYWNHGTDNTFGGQLTAQGGTDWYWPDFTVDTFNSFTDPGSIIRATSNSGMLSLDEATIEDHAIPTIVDWSNAVDSRLDGSNIISTDEYGKSTAISSDGSIVVVTDSIGFEAYVFVDGVETAILTGSDVEAGDIWGSSCAISADGSTIVVGSPGWDDPTYTAQGALYVYEKPGGGWATATEDAILRHTDATTTSDNLGRGVVISDDGSIIVAAERHRSTTISDRGAVQVYTRPGAFGTWTSSTTFARLTASDAAANDNFGDGLAISGDGTVIAVGAPQQDDTTASAGKMYVFEKPVGNWATATEDHAFQFNNVIACNFGNSCALNETGDLLAVGAPVDNPAGTGHEGTVRVFSYSASTWTEIAMLRGPDVASGDRVGNMVAMTNNGQYIIAGAYAYDEAQTNQGCVYVWEKPGGGWANSSSPTRLTDSNPVGSDQLTFSNSPESALSISDDGLKIIAGAKSKSYATLFDRNSFVNRDLTLLPWGGIRGSDVISGSGTTETTYTNITESSFVAAAVTTNDKFGHSFGMSADGSVVAVGATNAKDCVYVFVNGTEVATLTNSDTGGGDILFGNAGVDVSADGNTIAVGAHGRSDGGSYTNGGAIYIFEKPGGGWATATEDAILTHTPLRNSDFLGKNIALSEDGSTVVSMYNAGTASLSTVGGALVYERPGAFGTWATTSTYDAKLTRSTQVANEDPYGIAISRDGSTIALGLPGHDGYANNAGQVCIYEKGVGWTDKTEDHALGDYVSNFSSNNSYLGWAVSLNEDGTVCAVVHRTPSTGAGTGDSCINLFSTDGSTWSEIAILRANSQTLQYIQSVKITPDASRVIAGAYAYDTNENTNIGCIYVWDKPTNGWSNMAPNHVLIPSTATANSDFTASQTSESTNTIAVSDDGSIIMGGHKEVNSTAGEVVKFEGTITKGVSGSKIKSTGILSLSERFIASQPDVTPVYTFEMWGSGGGAGGPSSASDLSYEHPGPGGNGAYVEGTLTGIGPGTILELMVGHVGQGGIYGGTHYSGGGGGASAIRIQGGDIIAVAGGGGGGAGTGSTPNYDATGGAGGNSVDGATFDAASPTDSLAGQGGGTGTKSAAGTNSAHTNANPPTKTEDLQDGGDGLSGNNSITGGQGNYTNPAGWGGNGGERATSSLNEGAGGGGGGGYFGGAGGSGATGNNDAGAGGGGGGSYVNETYVSSYRSDVGSYETTDAHSMSAKAQMAGSHSLRHAPTVGKGGDGNQGVDSEDGNGGAIYILKDGVVIAYLTASWSVGTELTFTIP